MKFLLYSGSLSLILVSLLIGANASEKTGVLPGNAAQVAAQTGVTPVEFKANGLGMGLAGVLGLAGLTLGYMAANYNESEKKAVAVSGDVRSRLEELKQQALEQALGDEDLARDLYRNAVEHFRSELNMGHKIEPIIQINDVILPDVGSVAPAVKAEVKPKAKPKDDRDSPRYQWLWDLMDEGTILLNGRKGSGKTSKAQFLVEEYLKAGYQVDIVDPHAAAGQWEPLKVWGRGKNWREVNEGLKAFIKEVNRRYSDRAEIEGYDPMVDEPRLILVCEEMTQWADQVDIELMKEFWGVVLGDIRKANAGVLFISHGETLASIGGKALEGRRKTVDDDVAKLKCFGKPIPGTRPTRYMPLPYAELSIPTQPTVRVDVPEWMQGPKKFAHLKKHQEASKVVEFPVAK